MNRILIIQTAFLGDVILVTAVISETHRLYPDVKIDVLVKKGNESLLNNNPKINTVYTFNKQQGKFAEIRRLTKEFRVNKYDYAFNFHRFGSSGLITLLSGAKKTYGFKKNPFSFFFSKKFEHPFGDGTHEVERNLAFLKEFGGASLVRPELFPSDSDFAKVQLYQDANYFCLAPASVWFTKQLPKEKWVELIHFLGNESTIYLLGGNQDSDLCDEIIALAKGSNCINLAGKLSLLASAALMKSAQRNYVNDSGPLHIASAMNAPVTAFFCSTIPDFGFGPLSEDSIVKEVKGLECRPCGIHGHKKCPEGHFKCGAIIID